MADGRLRYPNSNANGSPSRVPLARISEMYDDDFYPTSSIPADKNHNIQSPDEPSTSHNTHTFGSSPEPFDSNQGDQGCNPVWPIMAAYFGAAGLFMLGMNVAGMSLLSYPWVGNLLSYEYQQLAFQDGVILIEVLWCAHFLRRFAEVMFVHIYRRKMPFFESIGAQIYYWMFGFWAGWSVNWRPGIDYRVPSLALFIPGIMIFLIGEVGNCYSHWMLRQMRLKPSGHIVISSSKRAIPQGFLFTYVSYPHYLFEIISWIGFYLAAHTLAIGIFVVCSIITVTIRAVKGHRSLKREFNGMDGNPLFPPNRKAIFPFLL